MKVEELLRANNNPNFVNCVDDDEVTPLQIAAFIGNDRLVDFLLSHGGNIEMESQTGMTPFLHACREGHHSTVQILLQRKADIFHLNKMGASALTLAAAGGHMKIIKQLISLRHPIQHSMGMCPTPLITASLRSFPQVIGYFAQQCKVPLDEPMDELCGLTALACAILCAPNTVALCSLLDCGADSTKRSLKRKTAIELAEQFCCKDAVTILREKSRGSYTSRVNFDVRQWILDENYEDIRSQCNIICADGSTPLMFAAAASNTTACRILLQMGADPLYAEPQHDLTALHIAALLRNEEIINLCLLDRTLKGRKMASFMKPFDYYISYSEENNPSIRATLLSGRPPKQDARLSSSSNTLSKLIPVKEIWGKAKSQLLLTPEKEFTSDPVKQKQWKDFRLKIWPVYGRNHQKLVTVESLLARERTLCTKRKMGPDAVMDVVKQMALESQSFTATCFYDYYNAGAGKKEAIKRRDGDDYDPALTYTSQLLPKAQRPDSSQFRIKAPKIYRNIDGDVVRRQIPCKTTLAGSQPTQRTTPRMLKKSRDMMSQEDRVPSPIPRNLLTHHELKKVNSSPQFLNYHMPTVIAPNMARLSRSMAVSDRRLETINPDKYLLDELKRYQLGGLVKKFREMEIDARTFVQLNAEDFARDLLNDRDYTREQRDQREEDLQILINLQSSLRHRFRIL